jgi:predicted Fe-Mo cluster-binding NifX family protein
MTIAIPVEGENLKIVKRTGQAPYFAIYNNDEFIKLVAAPKGHSQDEHKEHDHGDDEEHIQGHSKSLVNISECDLILVQAIGEHMKEALERENITIKKIRQKDGEFASQAIESYLKDRS